jgi:hypothetical protein
MEMIDQKKKDETAQALLDALVAVKPPDEIAIYVLYGLAVSLAIGKCGPKLAREMMTEILHNTQFTGADDTPDYSHKN